MPTQTSATAGVITQHLAVAGVGADAIDPETKLSSKYEFVAGYEYEVVANTSIGVRYIRRWIGQRARRRRGGANGGV